MTNPYTATTNQDGGVSPGLDRTSAPSQLSFKQSQGGSSGILTASMGPGAMRETGAGANYKNNVGRHVGSQDFEPDKPMIGQNTTGVQMISQQKNGVNPTPGLATVPIEIQQQISGAEIP